MRINKKILKEILKEVQTGETLNYMDIAIKYDLNVNKVLEIFNLLDFLELACFGSSRKNIFIENDNLKTKKTINKDTFKTPIHPLYGLYIDTDITDDNYIGKSTVTGMFHKDFSTYWNDVLNQDLQKKYQLINKSQEEIKQLFNSMYGKKCENQRKSIYKVQINDMIIFTTCLKEVKSLYEEFKDVRVTVRVMKGENNEKC